MQKKNLRDYIKLYVLQIEEEECVNIRRDGTFLNGSCDGTLNFRTSSIPGRMDQ
jgi:hypothetical protein